ncbi:MAG: MATE family efflux transporter [Flavobacteriales bacterium]|nr:MATE family efflux transporter [Flavobacteriales bacterium]
MGFKIGREYRENIILAAPVMFGQAANVLTGLVDNYMLAHIGGVEGETALAACAAANAIFILVLLGGTGISYGMTPFVSYSHAQNDTHEIDRIFRNGQIINICIGVISALLLLVTAPILSSKALGQDPAVGPAAEQYLMIVGLSMIPVMIFQTYKQTSDGMSNTWPGMIAVIIANGINVVANYALIYGHWGFDAMGVQGAAWGTFISRIFLVFIMIGIFWNMKTFKHFILLHPLKEIKKRTIKKILGIGTPTSLQMLFEIGVFSAATLLAGRYGYSFQSAHQVAGQMSGLTYTFVSGLAVASTIRVSHFMGKNDMEGMKKACKSIYVMVITLMSIFGVSFIIFRNYIPAIFFPENEYMISITAPLFLVVAAFELFDGVQVVSQGALRGLQDVKTPTVITAIGYWVVAFPLAIVFSEWVGLKVLGIWIGLSLGLVFCAVMLTLRLYLKLKKMPHIKP